MDGRAPRLARLLVALKAPLLLVGDGLAREAEKKTDGREEVEDAERRAGVPERLPRGQGEEQEEQVLVRRDERGVEDLEADGTQAGPQHRPAVVFAARA